MSENIILQQNEENVIVATFNINSVSNVINLKNLTGMSQIDWGDGTVDNTLNHTYINTGEYICKIYSVISIGNSAF